MAHAFPGFLVVEHLYASSRVTVERAVRRADNAAVVIKQSSAEIVAPEAMRRAQHEYDLLCAARGDGVIGVHAMVRDGSHVAVILEAFGDGLARTLAARRLAL